MGHSAGAHLCAMALSSDWFLGLTPEETSLFNGVILLSGIYDLKPLITTYVNEPLGMTVDEAEANSPLMATNVEKFVDNMVGKNAKFKTAILVADFDSPAFKLQSEKLWQVTKPIRSQPLTILFTPSYLE